MKSKLLIVVMLLAMLTGCSDDIVVSTDSDIVPPFEADWNGHYIDIASVSRTLKLSLKVDSINNISGTFALDNLDSLGVVVTAAGISTGQVTSDTTATIIIENDAIRWRLSGTIAPPFRYSGSWVDLVSQAGSGTFSVTK